MNKSNAKTGDLVDEKNEDGSGCSDAIDCCGSDATSSCIVDSVTGCQCW